MGAAGIDHAEGRTALRALVFEIMSVHVAVRLVHDHSQGDFYVLQDGQAQLPAAHMGREQNQAFALGAQIRDLLFVLLVGGS